MSRANQVNVPMVGDQPAKLLSYEAILADLGLNLIKASSGCEALWRPSLARPVATCLYQVVNTTGLPTRHVKRRRVGWLPEDTPAVGYGNRIG